MRSWLKEAREKNGVTMAEMAQKLDISLGYYSLIESGKRQQKMDITLLAKISSALGVQLAEAILNEVADNEVISTLHSWTHSSVRKESYDVASQNPGRGQLRRLKTGTLHFKDLKRGILAVWQH